MVGMREIVQITGNDLFQFVLNAEGRLVIIRRDVQDLLLEFALSVEVDQASITNLVLMLISVLSAVE